MTAVPMPEVTPLSQPYWDGLAAGELRYQHCGHCGHRWLPAREQCPCCLASEWSWQPASGNARIISWVVYHQSMHPAFADRVPYNVAVVELDEGPRMITNIDAAEADLAIERRVSFVATRTQPPVARFVLAGQRIDGGA